MTVEHGEDQGPLENAAPRSPMADSRREFLKSMTVATAGVAAGPLLVATHADSAQAPVEAAPLADGSPGDKLKNLAPFRADTGINLTTNQGLRIADDQNSLKAGARGPTLLEDHILREKITHFDHERIPERVVHARGAAAHGFFQVYEPMANITQAKFLQNPATKTPVFVRFSTVAGSRGSADTARDVRGFAVKFYTEEGNFDLVGNNIPVFFIQDAIKFPDLIHAVKPEPDREIPQASSAHDTFWDFISLMPESTHMMMWVMSDRAIPRSYRMMEGFGVHTFRFVNAQGKSTFVKFHWKPLLGTHSLAWDEAQILAGKDPDFHRRDLADAIDAGAFPQWEFGVQLISEADAAKFDFDILDATKLIPEEIVPVKRIGKLTLNRNPDNFFAETEQVAFHPGHLVPGIDFSDDPLLQGRLFSYLDTQLTRLGGPNFHEIPINRALCPFSNNQRDGLHRQTINKGRVSYEPNSLATGQPIEVKAQPGGFQSFAADIRSPKVRQRSETFADHYSQAALFWRSQTDPEKDHIVLALQFELSKVETPAVRERMLQRLAQVDSELAARVAPALGAAPPAATKAATGFERSRTSPALSMISNSAGSAKTRSVAILAADGVDGKALTAMKTALEAAGAKIKVIAPHLGKIAGTDGRPVPVDYRLASTPSVIFDALFVPGGAQSVAALKGSGDALRFVMEAYKHYKAIAVTGEATELLVASGVWRKDGDPSRTPGVVVADANANPDAVAKEFIDAIAHHRHWTRANADAVPA